MMHEACRAAVVCADWGDTERKPVDASRAW